MPNGSILAEYKRKIDNNETIPQNVTNGVLLTGLIELYGKFGGIEKSIDDLRKCIERDAALEKSKEERTVTWPYLWENFGKDIVKILIALAISYVLLRAGLVK